MKFIYASTIYCWQEIFLWLFKTFEICNFWLLWLKRLPTSDLDQQSCESVVDTHLSRCGAGCVVLQHTEQNNNGGGAPPPRRRWLARADSSQRATWPVYSLHCWCPWETAPTSHQTGQTAIFAGNTNIYMIVMTAACWHEKSAKYIIICNPSQTVWPLFSLTPLQPIT